MVTEDKDAPPISRRDFLKLSGLFGLSLLNLDRFKDLSSYLALITPEDISFLKKHVIKQGDTSKKIVILTYDDGGSEEKIDKVLKTYSQYSLHTTFFVTGEWVERNPYLVKKIINEGHDLGCHGFDHKELTSLSTNDITRQLTGFLEALFKVDPSYQARYFRPPYGSYDDRVVEVAARLGMQTVLWGLGSGGLDGVENTVKRVLDGSKNGTIVLSHSTRYFDVEAVPDIVDGLLQRELTPVKTGEGLSPSDVWIPSWQKRNKIKVDDIASMV